MLRGIYPGTARDVLLRNAQTRDSLCTRQWATTPAPLWRIPSSWPNLHVYQRRTRDDQRRGRPLSKHAQKNRVSSFFLSLSFLNLFNPSRENVSSFCILYLQSRSEWKRCWNWFFFMGQLFFQCHDYEKENFKDSFNIPFLFTQIRRAISFKETLFAKLLKLATMNIFI